jgi:hypothetical protein
VVLSHAITSHRPGKKHRASERNRRRGIGSMVLAPSPVGRHSFFELRLKGAPAGERADVRVADRRMARGSMRADSKNG